MDVKTFRELTEFVMSYFEKIGKKDSYVWEDVRDAIRAGAEWRDTQIPKLPANLDEAAEDFAEEEWDGLHDNDGNALYTQDYIGYTFKAGAKWMAEQGVTKEAIIGMATEDIAINVSGRILDALELGPGDKVKIILIKYNEQ